MTSTATKTKPEAPEAKEEETIRGTQSTARLSIWIAVVIIAIALIGYMTSRSSFKAEDVAAGISQISENMAGYLAANGYEGEFTYASLALEGNLFSRKAVVKQPEFVLRNSATGEEIHFSTEYMVIAPDNASLQNFNLIMEKPLQVSYGDVSYRIIQELPVKMAISREETTEKKALTYTTAFGEGTSFIVQIEGIEGDVLDASYQFHIGVGSSVKGVLDMTKMSFFEEDQLKGFSLEFGQSIMKADSMKFVYEVAGHDDSKFRHYTASGDKITFVGPRQGLGELAVAFEMEEEVPLNSPREDREVSINSMNIKGEDFTVTGTGQLEFRDGEVLPYGSLGMQIASMDQLLSRLGSAQVIPTTSVPLVEGVLDRAATPTQDPAVVELKLQRSPGGAFIIGNSTFEELAVSLLRDMAKGAMGTMKGAPVITPPVTTAPAAEVPPVAEPVQEAPAAPADETAPTAEKPEAKAGAAHPSNAPKIESEAEAMKKLNEIMAIVKERRAQAKLLKENAAEDESQKAPEEENPSLLNDESTQESTSPKEEIAPPSSDVKAQEKAVEKEEAPAAAPAE